MDVLIWIGIERINQVKLSSAATLHNMHKKYPHILTGTMAAIFWNQSLVM